MLRRGVTVKRKKRVGFSTRGKYWFDDQAAEDAIWFIENLCTHVKGELAGKSIHLEDWQRFIIEELYGWKRKDSDKPEECTRRYRILWLEIPRKNGKSLLAACLALLGLFFDDEPGSEVYSAAGDREQAGIVYDLAKTMCESEPELLECVQIFGGWGGHKRTIVVPQSGSFYRVLSSDAFTKHGLNAHVIVVDEVHVQRTRELIDTLRTSTGSRRQPLEIYITTAGSERNTICWELHDYAKKIISGVVEDDSFLPFVWAATDKDDWTDPAVWAKANPNLGVSVQMEFLEQECQRAKETPGYQNVFRRLFLNQWTEQDIRWLDMRRWNRCRTPLRPLGSRRCFAGLDLASTTDIAALALLFEPEEDGIWDLLCKFWVPELNLLKRAKRDAVPYDVWTREGLIKATEGNLIDYDVIRADVNQIAETYRLEEVAIDRLWNSTQITTQLINDGISVVPFGQGFMSMAAPTRHLEELVNGEKIRHGGNKVLTWMASNVAVKTDPAGSMKPDKERSSEKIDGIVATIMAIGRAIVCEQPQESIYMTRGMHVI